MILGELQTRITDIVPYVEQLDLLSHGKMQPRHWDQLFESCGQTGYHDGVTIDALLNLGILKEKEKIEQITAASQGESELETEFVEISNRWKKVQMPLLEGQMKPEETLLLGPTGPLLSEIQDTMATLSRMLALPYVESIRDTVSTMSSTFENLSRIVEVWQMFQSNWVILLALFAVEEARSTLPQQSARFTQVQRKWMAVTRHALKDTHRLAVCGYTGLLELLTDSNRILESILAGLGKFLDAKRAAVPRLYFLSNDEVLTLVTTNQFPTYINLLSKLFMHVVHIDCHEKEGGEVDSLSRLKMYGLVGEDGDVLTFAKHVQCTAALDAIAH